MIGNPFELRDDYKTKNTPTPDPFGRLGLDEEPDTEIADIKNPTELKSSIGDTGQNSRRDVAKTEQLLGQAGTLDLKKTDGPTGYWGTRTSDATKAFQKQNGLKVDAEIKPNGPTIEVLSQTAKSSRNNDKSILPGETPEIEAPMVDPNMPVLNKPLPQWDFRTLPYVDENGNVIIDGENPRTKRRVRPPKGPI